ncbi:hypothetical protein XENE109146_19110 [Xenorhabdus nematophila]
MLHRERRQPKSCGECCNKNDSKLKSGAKFQVAGLPDGKLFNPSSPYNVNQFIQRLTEEREQ